MDKKILTFPVLVPFSTFIKLCPSLTMSGSGAHTWLVGKELNPGIKRSEKI